MKKLGLLLLLLVASCVQKPVPTQLDAPQAISYNNKNYYLISHNDLGTIVRYFYVGQGKNSHNWHTAIELLLDRKAHMDFASRIAFRKNAYLNQAITDFDSYQQQGYLYSYVIYPPTAQNPNWQIDVAKGQNIINCGFVQFQYSLKLEKTGKLRHLTAPKLQAYLKKYAVDKELQYLQDLPWQWGCQQ